MNRVHGVREWLSENISGIELGWHKVQRYFTAIDKLTYILTAHVNGTGDVGRFQRSHSWMELLLSTKIRVGVVMGMFRNLHT